MFGLIKKIFIVLLTSIGSVSNLRKFASLSSQKCMIQPTLINLHPNEYCQEFHYYPFAIKLDSCVEGINSVNDLLNKVCVLNKTEDLNLSMFNMITEINELKTLLRHISCKYKWKFNGKKCNSDQWWNNDKCRCEFLKCHVSEKDHTWDPATCSCENGKYLASIVDDSTIACDEIVGS